MKVILCTRSELKKLMTNPIIDETQSAELNGGTPCPAFPGVLSSLHLSETEFARFVNIAGKRMLYAAGKKPEVRAVEVSLIVQTIEESSAFIVDPTSTP